MGGRGSRGGISLSAARADVNYAESMYRQAARRLEYVESSEARTSMEQWSVELRKAREAYAKAEERERKKEERRRRKNDIPF